MINFKAVFIAALLCVIIPVQSSGCVEKSSNTYTVKGWWNLLYPQYSGSKIDPDKNTVVKIKLLEIFEQN
jgi:hypothetical protein